MCQSSSQCYNDVSSTWLGALRGYSRGVSAGFFASAFGIELRSFELLSPSLVLYAVRVICVTIGYPHYYYWTLERRTKCSRDHKLADPKQSKKALNSHSGLEKLLPGDPLIIIIIKVIQLTIETLMVLLIVI